MTASENEVKFILAAIADGREASAREHAALRELVLRQDQDVERNRSMIQAVDDKVGKINETLAGAKGGVAVLKMQGAFITGGSFAGFLAFLKVLFDAAKGSASP
jgi:hypothetical protein